jgi:hypothetical protein
MQGPQAPAFGLHFEASPVPWTFLALLAFLGSLINEQARLGRAVARCKVQVGGPEVQPLPFLSFPSSLGTAFNQEEVEIPHHLKIYRSGQPRIAFPVGSRLHQK